MKTSYKISQYAATGTKSWLSVAADLGILEVGSLTTSLVSQYAATETKSLPSWLLQAWVSDY